MCDSTYLIEFLTKKPSFSYKCIMYLVDSPVYLIEWNDSQRIDKNTCLLLTRLGKNKTNKTHITSYKGVWLLQFYAWM